MIFRLAAAYDELVAAQLNNVILCSLARPLPAFGLFCLVALLGTLALLPWLVLHERRVRAAALFAARSGGGRVLVFPAAA